MSRSGALVLLIAAVVLIADAGPAAAQAGLATVLLSAEDSNGTPAVDARLDLTSSDGIATQTIVITRAVPHQRVTLRPGLYRVRVQLNGFRETETTFYGASGSHLQLKARLMPGSGTASSQILIADQSAVAHQRVYSAGDLTALPTSGTIWSLLETTHPYLIADRIDNGGLWSAEPSLVSGYGSSWSQTTFRLDGLDVTDPLTRGAPIFYPDLGLLESVEVDSARLPVEMGGPGSVIVMVPRNPGTAWTGSAHAFVTPRSWQGDETGAAVPIARFESWTDGGVVAGGPVRGNRLGLLASARVTRSERAERSTELVDANLRSVFAHARARLTEGDELRLVTSFSDITRPFAARARFADRDLDERVREVVLHPIWERTAAASLWSVSGGFQRFSLNPRVPVSASGGTIERLQDGPPLALTDAARSVRQRWDAGVTLTPALKTFNHTSHLFRLGVSLGGSTVSNEPVPSPVFRELLNGRPSHVWDVSYAGPDSRRHAVSASAFASDRLAIASGLTLDAGLRLDYDNGSADGAANTIRWTDLSPRFSVRWRPAKNALAITSAYSWYAHRLPLTYLAVGDPAGPSGSMYRWDDFNGDRQYVASELTRVAAVGVCCSGSTIDTELRRPTTKEFIVGVEHAFGSWRWSITGLDRREYDAIGVVNSGVTTSDYSVTYISDPGIDIAGLAGFNQLPVYNRNISSFGRDRYLLTNPQSKPSRYQGVEITVEKHLGSRWHMRFGGTAHRGEGIGAYRGYRADENDQGIPGEVFLNPNAETSAYGRLFFDRGYAIKVSGGYEAPGDVRLGLAARYQDGQPFARLVIVDSLNQGAEAIQAYPRGGQRFTYTVTLDARVEKDISVGRRKIGLVFEAFNLLDNTKEVEEDIVTGPRFRTVTAVQPPRALRAGARFIF